MSESTLSLAANRFVTPLSSATRGVVENRSVGLCWIAKQAVKTCPLAAEFKEWMSKEMTKWPRYSGNIIYPVPAPVGDEWMAIMSMQGYNIEHAPEANAFCLLQDVWVGEYGASRIALAKWLLPRVEDLL